MGILKLIGSYTQENEGFNFTLNQSENISETQIKIICEEMQTEKMELLTIYFDSGHFIFFYQHPDKIRFIEGEVDSFPVLQKLVRDDVEGRIIVSQYHKPGEAEKAVPAPEITSDETSIVHNSLFTPLSVMEETFSRVEVYLKPFQEPGGDFYWAKNYQFKSLIVVGDCTGHGMQGAMISMSIMTLLKQLFRLPPNAIQSTIYEFYENLYALVEDEDMGTVDCELCFLLIDNRSNTLEYIGSGVNMIVKSNQETTLYETRKVKVVKKEQEPIKLQLEKGDQLIVFTDGIPDQFDGSNKKKLGSRVKDFFSEIPQPVTKSDFIGKFQEFAGATQPLDDQTVLFLTV